MTIGYDEIYMPLHPKAKANGCVLKQRIVAEEMLGRYLKDEEVVHHKDENRHNNIPSNLMVFKSQSHHARFHLNKNIELICMDGVYECKPIPNSVCPVCNNQFVGYKGQIYCSNKCSKISQRKVVDRPNKQELLKLLENNSYCEVGRVFGVSDNTIRKWLK